jgi:hypothetical protein
MIEEMEGKPDQQDIENCAREKFCAYRWIQLGDRLKFQHIVNQTSW